MKPPLVETYFQRTPEGTQRQRKQQTGRAERLRAEGLCTSCGKQPLWRPESRFCEACLTRTRNRQREKMKDPAKRLAHAAYQRANKRKVHYGITDAQYNTMFEAQGQHCAMCPRTDNLHIDHDHATGRFRGILCNLHNVGLGYFKDSPEQLEAAAAYLRGVANADR